ncbi:MAG TPA: sensor histidine kinase, partial [Steroidobacteraceae bacterium]
AEFEHVFTPFYRRRDGGSSTGNGLGLSLVRQIARRHGGDAHCTPKEDGRGCFVVSLALHNITPSPAHQVNHAANSDR